MNLRPSGYEPERRYPEIYNLILNKDDRLEEMREMQRFLAEENADRLSDLQARRRVSKEERFFDYCAAMRPRLKQSRVGAVRIAEIKI
ncbi:hypothetical protein [Methylovirgula sp. 4M-Z18]|uniref:hypothetical protein n=1 Tax=Methylovirgula sp. 4M-Z18 TaxID=2293567 RepID=UPI001AEC97F6|nr:hypothetical protein [Methylovirgula sp. 4M-Z18]